VPQKIQPYKMEEKVTDKPWSDLFVSCPHVTEKILDYLMDADCCPGEFHDLMPLRLVSKGLKSIVDNYEPLWECFDHEQPLNMPVMFGNVAGIERLLAKGVDINKQGEEDRWIYSLNEMYAPNPLLLAAKYGIMSSAKTLVDNGADLTPGKKYQKEKEKYGSSDAEESEDEEQDSEWKQWNDWFDSSDLNNDPMQVAAANGHISMIEYFLGKGVDIDAKDAKGQTALFAACDQGSKEAALWLIEKGADVHVEAGSDDCEWIDLFTMVFDIGGWEDVYRVMREASISQRASKRAKKT